MSAEVAALPSIVNPLLLIAQSPSPRPSLMLLLSPHQLSDTNLPWSPTALSLLRTGQLTSSQRHHAQRPTEATRRPHHPEGLPRITNDHQASSPADDVRHPLTGAISRRRLPNQGTEEVNSRHAWSGLTRPRMGRYGSRVSGSQEEPHLWILGPEIDRETGASLERAGEQKTGICRRCYEVENAL